MLCNAEDSTRHAENVRRKLESEIRNHKIVLYSKSYCPFSRVVKRILDGYQINDLKVIELDYQQDMSLMQDHLKEKTGIRTVPQLFIDSKFIGDQRTVKAMENDGTLENVMLRAADPFTKDLGIEIQAGPQQPPGFLT
ncbi:unnamed protein product [Dracunculus medinensis]|uniref:Glutaredoxin domain-containing protein n=1 Tax=Dracunculus medinensis TaxID=318479 RepID=A0A0N4UC23_DRAME|nr:unnamed protein product [Dracunculus medinensis]